jgi:hypothetical protein
MIGIRKTRTVYIISSMLFNKSYIGSTGKTLNQRLSGHKHKKTCRSWEVMQHGDYMIAPLLIVLNCTRHEIELKEKEFLTQYKNILVNKNTVLRTKQERNIRRKPVDNTYYNNNLIIIKNKQSLKTDCVCGGHYRHSNKSYHLKSKKHLEFLNP